MLVNFYKSAIALGVFVAPAALATTALAQQPAGLRTAAPATGGSTEVAKEGFAAAAARAAAEEEAKDATTLKLTGGGFVSQGNSRTIALTSSADFFLRRSESAFSALAAANYGRSSPGVGEAYETTVSNYQARLRYDYFFATSVAGFFSVSARHDEFQGLALRLNFDPGLAYYFIDEKSHRLWAELGYDLQYDRRAQDYIDEQVGLAAAQDPPVILVIAETETRHNVRAFIGYDNQLSDSLKFGAGLEYLQNIPEAKNARINFDAALTAQLNQDFSIATTVAVKFDNNPLPGVENTDLITALNLVYTVN